MQGDHADYKHTMLDIKDEIARGVGSMNSDCKSSDGHSERTR